MGHARAATILLVEDELSIRLILEDVLIEEGYQVIGAHNGRDALDLLHSGVHPQLILLDLMMPVLDGWRFRQEQLRDPALADIPVVVITAGPVEHAPRDLEVLSKPLRIEDLLRVARAMCPTPRRGA